ncbi:MAG: hypothetical protein U0791_08815 [Gemmataceae bacterium]
MPAAHLRIRVSVPGRTVADLTFPAAAAERIGDLVPGPVADQLRAKGIDAESIGRDAADAGFPRGELFATDDDAGKRVRVWLE